MYTLCQSIFVFRRKKKQQPPSVFLSFGKQLVSISFVCFFFSFSVRSILSLRWEIQLCFGVYYSERKKTAAAKSLFEISKCTSFTEFSGFTVPFHPLEEQAEKESYICVLMRCRHFQLSKLKSVFAFTKAIENKHFFFFCCCCFCGCCFSSAISFCFQHEVSGDGKSRFPHFRGCVAVWHGPNKMSIFTSFTIK